MNPPGVRYCRWSDITNLVNQKRVFTIECQRAEDSAQFVFSEQDLAKYVWKTCVAQHSFFKGQTVPVGLVERVQAQQALQLQAQQQQQQQNNGVDGASSSSSSCADGVTNAKHGDDGGEVKRFELHPSVSAASPSRSCVVHVEKSCPGVPGGGNGRPGDAILRCQLYDEQVINSLYLSSFNFSFFSF
jgi:hypothetical protein